MRDPIVMARKELQDVIDTRVEVTVIINKVFDEMPEKDRPIIE